jgi:hypothetical protein
VFPSNASFLVNGSFYQISQYFSTLKEGELLELLSFCNRLRSGLLVDIMASICKKHPNFPVFNSPDWAAVLGGASSLTSQSGNVLSGGHIQSPNGRKPKSRTKSTILRKHLKPIALDDITVSYEDVLPPDWPTKPGQGAYSKLAPERSDQFLYDPCDEEAFSHFQVNADGSILGDQIVAMAALADANI